MVIAADGLGHQDRAADRRDLKERRRHLHQAGNDDLGRQRIDAQLPRQHGIEDHDAEEQRLFRGHLQRQGQGIALWRYGFGALRLVPVFCGSDGAR